MGDVVGVAHVMAESGAFPAYIAKLGHEFLPGSVSKDPILYQREARVVNIFSIFVVIFPPV
jgi:hypothetical protein